MGLPLQRVILDFMEFVNMNLHSMTPNGPVPLTEEEVREVEARQKNWKENIPERERIKKIKDLSTQLEVSGIEHIMDTMNIEQRKRLPIDMQKQYDDIKTLRSIET